MKKSGFGALGIVGALAPIAGMIPKAGAGAIATMNAASAAERAFSLAESASAVKAKTEVILEYNLMPIAGSTVLAASQKAKAKTDGEDVITPLIQEAASHILASLTK